MFIAIKSRKLINSYIMSTSKFFIDQAIQDAGDKKWPKQYLYFLMFILFLTTKDSESETRITNYADNYSMQYYFMFSCGFNPLTELIEWVPWGVVAPAAINFLLIAGLGWYKKIGSNKVKKSWVSLTIIQVIKMLFFIYILILDKICYQYAFQPLTKREFNSWSIAMVVVCLFVGASTLLCNVLILVNQISMKTQLYTSSLNARFLFILLCFKFLNCLDLSLGIGGYDRIFTDYTSLILLIFIFLLLLQFPFFRFCANKSFMAFVFCVLACKVERLVIVGFDITKKESLLTVFLAKLMAMVFGVKMCTNWCQKIKSQLMISPIKNDHLFRILQLSLIFESVGKDLSFELHQMDSSILTRELQNIMFSQEITRENNDRTELLALQLYSSERTLKLKHHEAMLIAYYRISNSSSFLRGFAMLTEIASKRPSLPSTITYKYIYEKLKVRARSILVRETRMQKELHRQLNYDEQTSKLRELVLKSVSVTENGLGLLTDQKKMSKLFWVGVNLHEISKEVMDSFMEILKKFPDKRYHFLLVSLYAEHQRGSIMLSRKLMDKYSVIHSKDNKQDKLKNIFEEVSRMTGYVMARTTSFGDLRFFYASPYFGRLFGYSQKEIMEKEVEEIVPPCIAAIHKEMVVELCRRGRATALGEIKEMFGYHRRRILFPVNILISLNLQRSSDLTFLTAIRRKKDPTNVIMAYPNGIVDCFGVKAQTLFNFPLDVDAMNLFIICPELEVIFQIVAACKIKEVMGKDQYAQLILDKKMRKTRRHKKKEASNVSITLMSQRRKKVNKNISDIVQTLNPDLNIEDEVVQEIYSIFTNEWQMNNVLLFDIPRESFEYKDMRQLQTRIGNIDRNYCHRYGVRITFNDAIFKKKFYIHQVTVEKASMDFDRYIELLSKVNDVSTRFNVGLGFINMNAEITKSGGRTNLSSRNDAPIYENIHQLAQTNPKLLENETKEIVCENPDLPLKQVEKHDDNPPSKGDNGEIRLDYSSSDKVALVGSSSYERLGMIPSDVTQTIITQEDIPTKLLAKSRKRNKYALENNLENKELEFWVNRIQRTQGLTMESEEIRKREQEAKEKEHPSDTFSATDQENFKKDKHMAMFRKNSGEEDEMNKIQASLSSSNSTKTSRRRIWSFLENAYNEEFPTTLKIINLLMNFFTMVGYLVALLYLGIQISGRMKYVETLGTLVNVVVEQTTYSQTIYRCVMLVYLYDHQVINKNIIEHFGVDDFRAYLMQELYESAQYFYNSEFEFYDALSYFSMEIRESMVKEYGEFYMLSDDGTEIKKTISLPNQYRNLFSYGMSCANRTETLSLSQPDTYYLLKNCLDGVLEGFRSRYFTSKDKIEEEITNINSMLLGLLFMGLALPPFSFTVVYLFALSLRQKMQWFLSGLYVLNENEIEVINNRTAHLREVFSDGVDETSFKKCITGDLYNNSGDDHGKRMSGRYRTNFKGGAGKATSSMKRKEKKYLGVSASLTRVYFRFLRILCLNIIVLCTFFGAITVFYFLESQSVSKVADASTFKEEVKTQFLEESRFYTAVISYIGTNGTSFVTSLPIEETIAEQLQTDDHNTFIENYMLVAAEKSDTSSLYEILNQAESSDLCTKILSDNIYCSEYGGGVYKEGLSTVIEYTYVGLKTTITEFMKSSRATKDQQTSFENTILTELCHSYQKGSSIVYTWVSNKLFEKLQDHFTQYYLVHYLMLPTILGIILVLFMINTIGLHYLVSQDTKDIKEVYRLVSYTTYLTNKYLKNHLFQSSARTVSELGTKFFT